MTLTKSTDIRMLLGLETIGHPCLAKYVCANPGLAAPGHAWTTSGNWPYALPVVVTFLHRLLDARNNGERMQTLPPGSAPLSYYLLRGLCDAYRSLITNARAAPEHECSEEDFESQQVHGSGLVQNEMGDGYTA